MPHKEKKNLFNKRCKEIIYECLFKLRWNIPKYIYIYIYHFDYKIKWSKIERETKIKQFCEHFWDIIAIFLNHTKNVNRITIFSLYVVFKLYPFHSQFQEFHFHNIINQQQIHKYQHNFAFLWSCKSILNNLKIDIFFFELQNPITIEFCLITDLQKHFQSSI